jgi:synaptobrevin family protein YKT6
VNKYKIAAAILTDDQYPERVAFEIINRMHKEFASAFDSEKMAEATGTFTRHAADQNLAFPKLNEYIKNYQDPKEVDKLEKLKESLKEVEGIVHKNLDDVNYVLWLRS